MITAESLFNKRIKLPDLSIFPINLPTIESPKNQIHETRIHTTMKVIFAGPE